MVLVKVYIYRYRIELHSLLWVRCAEQECHLLKDRVDTHYLDQNSGYKIKDNGTSSCDKTSKLTFEECQAARFALDAKATAVTKTNNKVLPTGCYRQQQDQYRFQHDESSYKWYFNNASIGQSHSKSEPVCKGKAKWSCLCAHSRKIIFARISYLRCVKIFCFSAA